MKKIYSILSLMIGLTPSLSKAQNPPVNSFLDINNIKMSIQSNGDIGWDNTNPTSEAPIGSGNTFLFTGNIWMGGLDEEDSLHLAANSYNYGYDYWAGPVSNIPNSDYNRSWSISREQIETHIATFGEANYIMPEVIENWPGNGDINNGENALLAPFKDLNNNTIYEPNLGEHPLIRGDKAVFVMYNDSDSLHANTGGAKISAEVHVMIYAYDSESQHLNNAIFFHYEVFNRGLENYTDFKFGTFLDWDLGYYDDDFIGCDTLRNVAFVYNGHSIDQAYGSNPPSAGIISLNHKMASHMFYNNDFNPITGNPQSPMDYYNYLFAKWKNGVQLTEGGNGTDTLSSPTNYIYPGSLSEESTWTEESANHSPADRKMIQAEHFDHFNSGSSLCLDYAMLYARDTNNTNFENVDLLLSQVDSLQNFYDNHFTDCSITGIDIENLDINELNSDLGISILFNDPNWILHQNNEQVENVQIRLFNSLGQLIQNNTWSTQSGDYLVDFNNQSKGIYFIELSIKDMTKTYQLIVK